MSDSLPIVTGPGLFFVADPHVADTSPGQRLPGYREQILAKLEACLLEARRREMPCVILGDLFHWPRDNSNQLLVELIRLLRPHQPWVLVGNHDKYQARWTSDLSMAVLQEAGAIRLMDSPGPQFELQTSTTRVLVGATPDGFRIPRHFERLKDGARTVLWCTHHNISFPDFEEKAVKLRELDGIDWVVNGHIHRPQPTVTTGQTTWANPGNIVRLTFSRRSKERIPAAAVWTPECSDLELWEVAHLPFYEVFPRQEFPPEEHEVEGHSQFLEGLERLAWRRSNEGTGIKEFLTANLNPERPETGLIWDLYKEVVHGEK